MGRHGMAGKQQNPTTQGGGHRRFCRPDPGSHPAAVGREILLARSLMSLKVIHFQSIFLIDFYLKRMIYVQKYGITHQTAMQQGIQEIEEFLQ